MASGKNGYKGACRGWRGFTTRIQDGPGGAPGKGSYPGRFREPHPRGKDSTCSSWLPPAWAGGDLTVPMGTAGSRTGRRRPAETYTTSSGAQRDGLSRRVLESPPDSPRARTVASICSWKTPHQRRWNGLRIRDLVLPDRTRGVRRDNTARAGHDPEGPHGEAER